MISYAQNFEDVMLNRAFKGQAAGFYVDVGAADPTNLSVTKWLYDSGWSGINIEPVREFYELLSQGRPRDINLNCGAGATAGEAHFHEYPVKEWSTFDLNASTSNDVAADGVRDVVVPIRTLNEILSEHARGRNIDFLKIDVEGWEEQVLRGLDLQRHRPTVILLEAIDRDTKERVSDAVDRLLHDAGYLSVYFDGINNFYLKQERADLKSVFLVPPNLFDDFKLPREAELEKVVEMQRAALDQAHAALDQAHIDLTAQSRQIENLNNEKIANADIIWIMETRIGRGIRPAIRFLKRVLVALNRFIAR